MTAIFHNDIPYNYAIVGGGCFGASTALALVRKWPDARIIWFEGTHTYAASTDINKIVRPNYRDKDYVAFAENSLKTFQTDALLSQYYHHTGWVQLVGKEAHENTVEGSNDRIISVEEMQQRVGSRDKPTLGIGEKLRLSENIGYVDFNLAIEAVAKEASRLGVEREKKDVSRLIVDGGVCQGVEIGNYNVAAKDIIITAGAWTPALLERSQIDFPIDFFIVSAVGVATMPLEEKEFDELKFMPILVTEKGCNPIDQILF